MMMDEPSRRRSKGVIRLALLGVLLLGSLVGLMSRPGAVAQEIQATPLTDEDVESFALASALTMTITSGPVEFGQLWTGETTQIESAAVVSVGGTSGGAWQLSCWAEPTAAHTTDLPVQSLEYARTGTADWAPFQTSAAPCTTPMNGDGFVRFNYRMQVPFSAAPGTFEVVVTYSVSAIE
jgi:hypothetical protein